MIIFSSTLDTEEKVISVYGGNQWTKIENRFLIGASTSYPNGSTGGATTHKHKGSMSNTGETYGFPYAQGSFYTTDANHIPPYRAVYIWERTQ